MDNFKQLQEIFNKTNDIEDRLKRLRDRCDNPTQKTINSALFMTASLRTALWGVDRSMAANKGV